MADSISPERENALIDQLREEADATRPDFSESLHTQICDSLAPCLTPRPRRLRPRAIVYGALTAACLALVALTAWQLFPTTEPSDPIAHTPTSQNPEVLQEFILMEIATAESLGDPPAESPGTDELAAVLPPNLADLNHDARIVSELLFNQLPLNALAANAEQ